VRLRLAQDEVAQEARLGAAVVGLELLLARPGQDLLARPGRPLGPEQGDAVDDLLPRAGAWKPQTSSPVGPVPKEYSSLLR
jgi:hypothetical protein